MGIGILTVTLIYTCLLILIRMKQLPKKARAPVRSRPWWHDWGLKK